MEREIILYWGINMPRTRKNKEEKFSGHVMSVKIGPLRPYEVATDRDITDEHECHELLDKKIRNAIIETLKRLDGIGFDQPHVEITTKTRG